MAKYAGLTDAPARRKQEHGNPADWKVFGPFATEMAARAWEARMQSPGFKGGGGGGGWRYGYTYTITAQTQE